MPQSTLSRNGAEIRPVNYPSSMCVDIAMATNGLCGADMITMSMWMKQQTRMPMGDFLDSQGALQLCWKAHLMIKQPVKKCLRHSLSCLHLITEIRELNISFISCWLHRLYIRHGNSHHDISHCVD